MKMITKYKQLMVLDVVFNEEYSQRVTTTTVFEDPIIQIIVSVGQTSCFIQPRQKVL